VPIARVATYFSDIKSISEKRCAEITNPVLFQTLTALLLKMNNFSSVSLMVLVEIWAKKPKLLWYAKT